MGICNSSEQPGQQLPPHLVDRRVTPGDARNEVSLSNSPSAVLHDGAEGETPGQILGQAPAAEPSEREPSQSDGTLDQLEGAPQLPQPQPQAPDAREPSRTRSSSPGNLYDPGSNRTHGQDVVPQPQEVSRQSSTQSSTETGNLHDPGSNRTPGQDVDPQPQDASRQSSTWISTEPGPQSQGPEYSSTIGDYVDHNMPSDGKQSSVPGHRNRNWGVSTTDFPLSEINRDPGALEGQQPKYTEIRRRLSEVVTTNAPAWQLPVLLMLLLALRFLFKKRGQSTIGTSAKVSSNQEVRVDIAGPSTA